MSKKVAQRNQKKKAVADGVFHAEMHSFLSKALAAAGYAGIEITAISPVKTNIKIKATKLKEVLGVEGRRLRELTSMVQKRFGYAPGSVELIAHRIQKRGLCASAQAESLKYKLLNQIPVRLAANSIIKGVLADGAKGCEVIISGKLKQQRAKTMKFKQGYMICSGQPMLDYVDSSTRHVFLKQGIMGVKVKVMMPHDPTGINGVKILIPDNVQIRDPKRDEEDEDLRTPSQPQQPLSQAQ